MNRDNSDLILGPLGALAGAAVITLTLWLGGPARAATGIHHGDTRTHVNHQLGSHGQKLWGYRDHGQQHRVRRYPTARPHVWTVVDYRVRPHHLRVWFVTSCRWSGDGVDCTPGATSKAGEGRGE